MTKEDVSPFSVLSPYFPERHEMDLCLIKLDHCPEIQVYDPGQLRLIFADKTPQGPPKFRFFHLLEFNLNRENGLPLVYDEIHFSPVLCPPKVDDRRTEQESFPQEVQDEILK